jgi:Cu(I)/Ag(I) efflux system periplasmic protein CusF
MKAIFAIVAAGLLAASASATAQTATTAPDAHDKNHPTDSKSAIGSYAEGEVRKIDRETGKITLKHGPIANLDMPAMSMVFRAAPAILDKVKEGDKVRFKAEKIQGSNTVTQIEPAK